jgi:hypothetical protein
MAVEENRWSKYKMGATRLETDEWIVTQTNVLSNNALAT